MLGPICTKHVQDVFMRVHVHNYIMVSMVSMVSQNHADAARYNLSA